MDDKSEDDEYKIIIIPHPLSVKTKHVDNSDEAELEWQTEQKQAKCLYTRAVFHLAAISGTTTSPKLQYEFMTADTVDLTDVYSYSSNRESLNSTPDPGSGSTPEEEGQEIQG